MGSKLLTKEIVCVEWSCYYSAYLFGLRLHAIVWLRMPFHLLTWNSSKQMGQIIRLVLNSNVDHMWLQLIVANH